MKEKIILAYSASSYSCLPLPWFEHDHGWSFSVCSSGTVKLTAWKSTYVFTIPQEIIDKITVFLKSKQKIIDALPLKLEGIRGTAGWVDDFDILGRHIHGSSIVRRRDRRLDDERFMAEVAKLKAEIADNNSAVIEYINIIKRIGEYLDDERALLILAGLKLEITDDAMDDERVWPLLDEVMKKCSADAVQDKGSHAVSCMGNEEAQNYLLELFAEVGSYLQPYGLSVIFEESDFGADIEYCQCEWNIPDLFYSFDEKDPIIKYYGEQSFALYAHGLLKVKKGNITYQQKIPQSVVDKTTDYFIDHSGEIKDYFKDHSDLLEEFLSGQWVKQIYDKNPMLIAVGNYDNDGGELRCSKDQIEIANRIFADIIRYLQPYGLEAELIGSRFSCRWPVPSDNPPGNVLFSIGNCDNDGIFTIYDCGIVHITHDLYLQGYDEKNVIKSVFVLPEEIVNDLRNCLSADLNEIKILADEPAAASGGERLSFSFMGTELRCEADLFRKMMDELDDDDDDEDDDEDDDDEDCDDDGCDGLLFLAESLDSIKGDECESVRERLNQLIKHNQHVKHNHRRRLSEPYYVLLSRIIQSVFKVLEPYGVFWSDHHAPSIRSVSNLWCLPPTGCKDASGQDADRT